MAVEGNVETRSLCCMPPIWIGAGLRARTILRSWPATVSKEQVTVDSKKLEYGFRAIYAGPPSFLVVFRSEDDPIPTFWLLLVLLYRKNLQ